MLLAAVILVGITLRILALASRSALWGDEAALAMNVEPRTFFELGRPFVYRQVAPWGVMAGIKIATLIFGTSDAAFRMFPFIGSVSAMVIVYPVARRIGGRSAGLLSVALVAVSNWGVFYATETKPYAIDAGVAALLFWLCARVFDARDRREPLISLTLVGIVAAWTSLAGLFVLGACGAALLWDALTERDVRRIGIVSAISAVWVFAFWVHYNGFIVKSGVPGSANAIAYWNPGFAPFPPKELSDLRWYFGKYFYAFEVPGGLGVRYVTGLVAALGIWVTYRRSKQMGILVAGPIALALLASMIDRYPIIGRLLMFATPTIAIVVGVGLGRLIEDRRPALRVAAVALGLLIIAPATSKALDRVGPLNRANFGDLMTALGQRRQPNEKVLIAGQGMATMYDHYGPKNGLGKEFLSTDDVRTFGEAGRFVFLPEAAGLVFGDDRVWLILSTFVDSRDPKRLKRDTEPLSTFIPRYFERHGGIRLETHVADDTTLLLYDLSAAVVPAGEARFENPKSGSRSGAFDSTQGQP